MYQWFGKRSIDICASAIGLLLAAPLLAVAAVAIRLEMGRPALFCQRRPGLNGKPFTIIKLRTMTGTPDADPPPDGDSVRLTPLGRMLRATSIDELPELWNVLRGEMSLVGPRPLFVTYLDRYTREQARRHAVRPGMTGWAQVNGRNALTWEEKLRLDVWYVDHQSFWLDLKILLLTVGKLITREGITQPGHATASEFLGTPRA